MQENWSCPITTPFCLIIVGYHSELCVAVTFTDIIIFYQPSYIIFFGVHANYLCYLGKKGCSVKCYSNCNFKWQPTLIRLKSVVSQLSIQGHQCEHQAIILKHATIKNPTNNNARKSTYKLAWEIRGDQCCNLMEEYWNAQT